MSSKRARLLLSLFAGSLSLAAPGAAEIIDRVVAVVDAEVITLSDVTTALRFGFVGPPAAGDPVRAALEQLIDRRLMMVEVDRYGPPEPLPEAIEAAVEVLRQQFGSASQLAAALARSGLAEDQLRRRLREDLRISAYLDQRFAGVGQGTDDERRRTLIRDWIASLRRRAEVTILYDVK